MLPFGLLGGSIVLEGFVGNMFISEPESTQEVGRERSLTRNSALRTLSRMGSNLSIYAGNIQTRDRRMSIYMPLQNEMDR